MVSSDLISLSFAHSLLSQPSWPYPICHVPRVDSSMPARAAAASSDVAALILVEPTAVQQVP